MKAIRKHKRERDKGRKRCWWMKQWASDRDIRTCIKEKEELWSKFRERRVSQYKGCDVGVEMI